MKKLISYLCLLLIALFSACSQKVLVKSHYNHDNDFSQITTFSWSPTQENNIANKVTFANDFNSQLVKEAIEQELTARGLHKISTNGDIQIEYFINVDSKRAVITSPLPTIDNFDEEYRVKAEQFKKATLTIHIENADGTATLWVGSTEGVIIDAPKNTKQIIESTINEIFSQFPFRTNNVVAQSIKTE
ncbi:DUF4136 domain-containing protein [Chondrinema litorale]|uniref:DUF4136 domain-containing protein n=1 Tax=Chondrinema litorale TaxID=2994555 RepID=UPI002542C249|nr:DUF4136 domain-containing protein [Chondrinema litorale]UZR94930.1 DUF4136 domain-containing protein [Chondrinema litorale]